MQYLNPKLIESVKERVLALARRAENAAAAYVRLYDGINAYGVLPSLGYSPQLQGIKETLTDLPFIYNACYNYLTSVVAEYGKADAELQNLLQELQCSLDIYLGGAAMGSAEHESAGGVSFAFDSFNLTPAAVPEAESMTDEAGLGAVLPALKARAVANPESILFLNPLDSAEVSPPAAVLPELERISVPGFGGGFFFMPSVLIKDGQGINAFSPEDTDAGEIAASQYGETMYILQDNQQGEAVVIDEVQALELKRLDVEKNDNVKVEVDAKRLTELEQLAAEKFEREDVTVSTVQASELEQLAAVKFEREDATVSAAKVSEVQQLADVSPERDGSAVGAVQTGEPQNILNVNYERDDSTVIGAVQASELEQLAAVKFEREDVAASAAQVSEPQQLADVNVERNDLAVDAVHTTGPQNISSVNYERDDQTAIGAVQASELEQLAAVKLEGEDTTVSAAKVSEVQQLNDVNFGKDGSAVDAVQTVGPQNISNVNFDRDDTTVIGTVQPSELQYLSAEKFERAVFSSVNQASGSFHDITLSDGLTFVTLPSAALVGAIALLKKANADTGGESDTTARQVQNLREMADGDRTAIRMFQLTAASAYLHDSPLSVQTESVNAKIPSAEVLPFASALDVSYENDAPAVNAVTVPPVGERIEAAEGLREIMSLIVQSSASIIRLSFDGNPSLSVDMPSVPFAEAVSLLPVDFTTGTVVEQITPPWIALASVSSAAVSLVLLLRSLPLASAKLETVTISFENKRVTVKASEFSSLMRLLPPAQNGARDEGIGQKGINDPVELYPVISENIGKIRVEAVSIWPWKEFTLGILLPEFASSAEDFKSAGKWDGGALPDTGLAGDVQAIPLREIMAANEDGTEDGGLVDARAVNDLLRIESIVTDGRHLNFPPVNVNELAGITPNEVTVTKTVYSPATGIQEQNISAFQPVPGSVTDIISSGGASGLKDLPVVIFEDENGNTSQSAVVPPSRSIERFDVEDAGDTLLIAAPVSSVDISGVTPEVKDLIKPIVSGDIFRDGEEITPAVYSQKLYDAVQNVSAAQSGDITADSQMKAVVASVAAAIANAVISNTKIESVSKAKTYEAKPAAREKEIYGGNAEIYPQDSKAEYKPVYPSADAVKDGEARDAYPSVEYKDGSKQTYVSENVYDESDPNNTLVRTHFANEGGEDITVSQPKGVRFWLERLYEMFVSLFNKGGKDEEEAVRTVARAMKRVNGDVMFGEDDGRMAVAMTDEADLADYLRTLKPWVTDEQEETETARA